MGIFARTSYSPSDRNLTDGCANATVELIGPADRRPHDKFGVAAACAHVSSRAQRLQSVYGPALPLRSSEILFTAVYPYEVQEGLTLQPNLQYVRHPGGGATGPLVPRRGERVPDATVVGLRAILKF